MWIAGRARRVAERETDAGLGIVTLEQDEVGVYADGERRSVAVFAPGGYRWRPSVGQEVLVLKTGADGELPCVAGALCAGGLAPGEVEISAGAAAVVLSPDGTVTLKGQVKINEQSLEEFCRTHSGGVSGGGTVVG